MRRSSKLDLPHIKEKVVKELATGKPQTKIAREVGIDQSQVSRWSRKEDVRELLEKEQKRLLQATPDAVKVYLDIIREKIPKEDIKRRELQLKASKEVLKSGGILPSPIHSQTFINMYQKNDVLLSPKINELLRSIDSMGDCDNVFKQVST
jgi:predicted transcriptional regulator